MYEKASLYCNHRSVLQGVLSSSIYSPDLDPSAWGLSFGKSPPGIGLEVLLFYNTPPWAITANAYASSKTPSEKSSGKKRFLEKRVHINRYCIAHVASSKTLCEKPSSKNSQREKEYNT